MSDKQWQSNFVITYWATRPIKPYQEHIHNALTALAFFYRVDVHIVSSYEKEHNVASCNFQPNPEHTYDLVYFRSQSQTKLDNRAFRKVVSDIFDKALNPFLGGAEVQQMLMRCVPYFPFPLDL